MTDRELHKLKRSDLLKLLLEQSREIARLKKQVACMERKLKSRKLAFDKIGSIAEASLLLNSIFTDAQKSADLYLENVERICREQAALYGAEDEWDSFLEESGDECIWWEEPGDDDD